MARPFNHHLHPFFPRPLRELAESEDIPILTHALEVLAEIFFAAGAHTIITGIHGVPDELHSLDEARIFSTREFRPGDFVTGGNHAFCTTRMHGDPRRGVVDEFGRCHDVDGLYIADTGVFPQCPSVNPMFTGMALARRQARLLSERLGPPARGESWPCDRP